MLIWRAQSTSFGETIHIEQSLVGKVLSSWVIIPPMVGDFSTRLTLYPLSARSREAWMPAIPAPITITEPIFPFRVFSAMPLIRLL